MKREIIAAIKLIFTLAEADGLDMAQIAKRSKLSLSTIYRLRKNPSPYCRALTLYALGRAVGLVVTMEKDGPRMRNAA